MKKLSLLFVASAIAVGSAYACGGEEPAKNPNDVGSASASATTSAAPTASADIAPTASVTATASVAPPPPEPPPIMVDGVKATGKGADGKALVLEVKADGTVNRDGKLAASFVKNELKNAKGETWFSVGLDGKVSMPAAGAPLALAFNDKDDLTLDGKPFYSIDDAGNVTVQTGAKAEKAPFKFDKLPPKSKRAAILLVPVIMGAKAMPAPASAASASAAPSAKPSAAPMTSAKPK